MKILTIVGARPQFIKSGVVSDALKNQGIEEFLLHTGQHFDTEMSQSFFDELQLKKPDFLFENKHNQATLQLSHMLTDINTAIQKCQPDWLLVYGDTTSTLAGALAANKSGIPLAHVESGLRSFNRQMPEEINRTLTDALSQICFCPDEQAKLQLQIENSTAEIFVSGDVMLDVQKKFLPKSLSTELPVEKFDSLLTLHRAENTDTHLKLQEILNGLAQLPIQVLFPAHPRLKNLLEKVSLPKNIFVTKPLSYLQILKALQQCNTVFTDSGGLQKEAYWLQKPCITLRGETEWTDTLQAGWNQLCDTQSDALIHAYKHLNPGIWKELYGDGNASLQIASVFKTIF